MRSLFSARARRRQDGRRVFETFRDRPGSRTIASEFALTGLIRELEHASPETILELGPGIGTTTQVLLELNPFGDRTTIWCVEENEWCREQMLVNLAGSAGRVNVVSAVGELPPEAGPFQFVLVDGPGDIEWVDRLAHRAVVFVENDRADQRAALLGRTNRAVAARSRWPFVSLGRLAGYHVFQFEPTLSERFRFAIGGQFNLMSDRLRMLNRRLLAKIGLQRVLEWDERRAYRDRLPPDPADVAANAQRRSDQSS